MAFKSPADVLKSIEDNDIQEVIFSFTDIDGALHAINYESSMVNAKTFSDGVMFDGSSVNGWKAIDESDMALHPDPTTARLNLFCSVPTLTIICDITDPGTGKIYNRDPRGVAKRVEAFVKGTGVVDDEERGGRVVGKEPDPRRVCEVLLGLIVFTHGDPTVKSAVRESTHNSAKRSSPWLP
ncbi:glutamine synthetase beta-grasp domain-containing protein [Rhizobium leguminosarum]|uniref:glutamine synthetase beta-grasp domain-containing protein n=1 Tax=Rhizobium leguminosarum TaxID=384 RepID=UPI003F943C6E